RNLYKSIAAEATSTLGTDVSNFFGAYSKEEDFIAILAEDLVNNTKEQPSHYATSRLWNHYRDQLTAVLDEPGLAAHQKHVGDAASAFLKAVEALDGYFRTVRSELSLTFDLPFVETVGAR